MLSEGKAREAGHAITSEAARQSFFKSTSAKAAGNEVLSQIFFKKQAVLWQSQGR